MKTCKTCKWWIDNGNTDICHPYDEDTFEEKEMPFEVRRCKSPRLLFHERPVEINGACVCDASEYSASLYTAEEFYCPLHEE